MTASEPVTQHASPAGNVAAMCLPESDAKRLGFAKGKPDVDTRRTHGDGIGIACVLMPSD